MEQGKLRPAAGTVKGTVTLHDPCYLGRHNDVIQEPRTSLQGINGNFVEMPRHGEKSFCCGAGGAQMWKEEEHGTAAVNMTRYEEAAASGRQDDRRGLPLLPDHADRRLEASGSRHRGQGYRRAGSQGAAQELTNPIKSLPRRTTRRRRVQTKTKRCGAGDCLPRLVFLTHHQWLSIRWRHRQKDLMPASVQLPAAHPGSAAACR